MNEVRQFRLGDGPGAIIVLAAWAILLGFQGPTPAQDRGAGNVGEYQLKAAFLYHFAKFVEWPSFKKDGAIVVGVLGPDQFGSTLDSTFKDKTLHGRRFEIRRVANAAEARSCHILFVSLADKAELARTLQDLSGSAVLTVGASKEFLDAGGMIYLFVEENKIRFDINLGAARQSQIAISAQLLRLARSVAGK